MVLGTQRWSDKVHAHSGPLLLQSAYDQGPSKKFCPMARGTKNKQMNGYTFQKQNGKTTDSAGETPR